MTGSIPGGSFEIASGHVSITARTDKAAREVKQFLDDTDAKLRRERDVFASEGSTAGGEYGGGIRAAADKELGGFFQRMTGKFRTQRRTFGTEGEQAGREFGRGFGEGADGLGHLDKQITEVTDRVRILGAEFDRTGDRGMWKELRKERSALSTLNSMRKELAALTSEAAEFAGSGAKSGGNFAGGITSALGPVGPMLTGGLIAAAATAAPAIGAAVSGAVLAGVGAAGIGAGVALAFQDPRVDVAASDLGSRVKTAFIDSADGMVVPTILALDVLGDASSDIGRQMGDAFDDLAPEVVPLAEAIGDLGRNALPGLKDAIDASRPGLRVLAKEFPEIGDAASDFFSTISEEGDGAILGLITVLDLAEGVMRRTGESIAWLSARFEDSVRTGAGFTGAMEDIVGWAPILGDAFRDSNNRAEGMLDTLSKAKEPGDTAAEALRHVTAETDAAATAAFRAAPGFDALFQQWMNVDESAIAVNDALRNVTESIKENGRSLDTTTEAGSQNAKSFLRGAEAAEVHRQAMIKNGTSVTYANQVYQETINKLYAAATAAGVNTADLDRLIGKYKDLANQPNINKTITYKQIFTSQGYAKIPVGGGHAFMAEGGIHYAEDGLINLDRQARLFSGGRTTFGFSEPGTGGEGFVAMNAPRDRSLEVMKEMGRWHKAAVIPDEMLRFAKAPASAPMSSGGGSMTAPSAGGTQPQMLGPYVIQLGEKMVASLVIDAVTGQPQAVAAAVDEGRRQRAFVHSPRART